jgi:mycothiol synthase
LSYELADYELAHLDGDEFERVLAATNLLNREARPRSVDLTANELRMSFATPGMMHHRFLVTDDGGSLAGLGNVRYPDDGTNADLAICQIGVLPQHRRRGIGSMQLARVAEIAEDLGRGRLQGFYFDTVPAGEAFATAVGTTKNLEFHENVLEVAAIDRDLMESWSRIGHTSPGYTIRLIEGPVPEDMHEDVAHLYHVLERDMPLSDDFEPRQWTANQVAEQERHYLEGYDALTALAIHRESRTAVGMSQMVRRKSDPSTWIVTVTMVDPEHRGRSLGKGLKGTVNVAALDEWEGGVYQETGNAFTNQPMLAINHAMGFEHEYTVVDCSMSLEAAKAYLATRS